ncbi:hypothetical protein Pint_06487 [Pistacia integerrima]|uniref:Uncharacterized protein n=1 Tax=Pistacia integerrima TaxID=434235 RepID=A0ACC0YZQ1_9ROSI|nr:hypothetical protein Pint_06487 [Pistacia integerrima]
MGNLIWKEKIVLFTKHLWIQSHGIITRTRDFSPSTPLALILLESERSFSSLNLFIWNLGYSTSCLSTYFFIIFFPLFSLFIYLFYSFPSFLKSHRFDPSIFSLSERDEINQIGFSTKTTM